MSDIRVICSFNIQKQGIDNQEAQGHHFVINQINQIRRNIWHVFNYNFTESIKSKLGEIIRLGPCICLDDIYVKIIYHFIFEHWQSYCISNETCFYFLKFLYCYNYLLSFILYVISCIIVFMLPLLSNSDFLLFITNNQIRNNICQVINYNFINTIKSEPTFGKSSICDQSSVSN